MAQAGGTAGTGATAPRTPAQAPDRGRPSPEERPLWRPDPSTPTPDARPAKPSSEEDARRRDKQIQEAEQARQRAQRERGPHAS
jgi:hypothetical protein